MAFSVTTIGTSSNASGGTVAITVGVGGVPAGAMIVVGACERVNAAPAGSVTDTAGNSYSSISSASLNATQINGYGNIFYAQNVAALVNGDTITFTKVGSGRTAISAFYVTDAGAIDAAVTAQETGSSTTPSVSSGTAAAANELFVGMVATQNAGTFTQDVGEAWATPFDESASGTGNGDGRVDGAYLVNGATTVTYNPTYSVSKPWAAFVVAFSPTLTLNGSMKTLMM